MANHPSAKKRHRQSLKRRDRNRAIRSRLRTERKKLFQLIDAGEKKDAEAQFQLVQRLFDRAADRAVVHPNKAARIVSRARRQIDRA